MNKRKPVWVYIGMLLGPLAVIPEMLLERKKEKEHKDGQTR